MRQVKTYIIISLAVLLLLYLGLLFPNNGQAAEKQPTLMLNGSMLDLPQAILQIDQSIMIPIRVVSEQLGYDVMWDGSKQLISIQSSRNSIQLTVDNKETIVNKETQILDVPATVQNQTTFVPLRFVGESMGLSVIWDNTTKTVHINEPIDNSNPSSTGDVKDNVVTALSYNNSTLSITSQMDIKPKVTVLNNPNRIVVDYANTVFSNQVSQDYELDVSGTGKITVTDHESIQQVRFSVFSKSPDPNAVRFVIDTNDELSYSVQQDTNGNFSIKLASSNADNNDDNNNNNNDNNSNQNDSSQTIPSIEPDKELDIVNPDVTPDHTGHYTVVIDAGHGGQDGGAESIHNRLEKDFALDTALKVAELARQESKLQILLTRSEDVYPTLTERVDFANQHHADLFISIHGNSVDDMNTVPNGTETYYYRDESETFAKLMHSYLVEGTGFRDRGYKQADHRVTHYTEMPAILLEVGFLTNPDNESQMFDAEFQWRVAKQILNGIEAQLGLQ